MIKYWALWFAALIFGRLPRPLGYALALPVADIVFLVDRRSRAAVLQNLRQVVGPEVSQRELRLLARQVFRNSARGYFDLISMRHADVHRFVGSIKMYGDERFEAELRRGKGVILASAHLGTPFLVAQVGVVRHWPLTILVEPVEPPRMLELFIRLRSRPGITYLPVGYTGLKRALQTLKQGGIVVMACDKALGRNMSTLEFMGKRARLPTGAVEMALSTGATLVPAFSARHPGGSFALYFDQPIHLGNHGSKNEEAVYFGMSKVVAAMEAYIRRYPDQWMLFEPVWDADGERGRP